MQGESSSGVISTIRVIRSGSSRYRKPSAAVILALAIFWPPAGRAQSLFGTIAGDVTDSTQSAVVGAKVVASNPDTGFTRETVTNPVGVYTVPDVPPGTYTVTVTATGFQTFTKTGIVVTVQSLSRLDVTLAVGSSSESITVSAESIGLQTDRTDVRSELTSQVLSNAPVPIGRNYQSLFITIPGVSQPQSGHSYGANPTRALAFTVNGGNINNNDTRVDGAGTRNFAASDTIQYIPAMEAIEAVSVATNSFDADQSTSGAAVNVTVKSGTNSVHGSLFEDHADKTLEAYQWVADRTKPKVPFIHNQFGGTIGGPIRRNKLFYFFSYEGTRLVQGNSLLSQVPTVAMRTGDLSASPTEIYDPLTGSVSGAGRQPFPNKVIPASRIDSGIQALLNTGLWPMPNKPGIGAYGLAQNYNCSGCQGNSTANRDQYDTKINWNPSTKLSMFARLGFQNGSWANPQIFGLLGGAPISPANGAVGMGGSHIFNGTVSTTYVFSPTLFVDAYFGYDRNDMFSNQPGNDKNLGWTLLGIPGLSTAGLPPSRQQWENGMPLLSIAGFGSLGPANQYQPQRYRDPERNYDFSLNWQKGTHNVRAGFEADLQDANEVQYEIAGNSTVTNAGGFSFAQGTTQLQGGPSGNDYNAFASFLLGLPQGAGKMYLFPQIRVPADQTNEFSIRERSYSAYVRDRWQVSPKFTVSVGLRWDYFRFPRRAGTGVEFYNPLTATASICGVASIPEDCGITKDRQHLGPRLGLAWRVTDSTVVRAGYSLSADPIFFEGHSQSGRENFPYLFAQTLSAPNSFSYSTTLRQGLPAVAQPDLSSGTVPVPGTAYMTTYDNTNYVRGYIQTWNFTVEQRVHEWIASAGYVASRAVDAQANLQMNWSPINGGAAGQILNKLTGRTASTPYMGTMGTEIYDGLQSRLLRRFSGGYQLIMAYTFSKAIGHSSGIQIPQYWALNRGIQGTNQTHTLSVVGIVPLPFGKGRRWAQSGFASKLAGGWQLSTILAAHSGSPFSITSSSTTLNAPFSGQRGDCLSSPRQIGSIYQWYDRTSFAVPASGRFGTCGVNNLFGPGMINSDLGLERRFPVRENMELTFRGEVFNLANTPHHSPPNGNVTAGDFMVATGIAGTGKEGIEQRAVRFAIRLGW